MTASQAHGPAAHRLFGPSWMSQMKVVTLTPFSLLTAIITVGLCSVPFSKPEPIPSSLPNWPENWRSWRNGTIWEIAQSPEYLTPITPLRGEFLGAFLGVLVMMQMAYCALFCTKGINDESRAIMMKTVGIFFVISNIGMSLWAVFWVKKLFAIAALCQALILLAMLFPNLMLLIYYPAARIGLETPHVHGPLRFFLVLSLNILFPVTLLVTLGVHYQPNPAKTWDGEIDLSDETLAFSIFLIIHSLEVIAILLRRDAMLCLAAIWSAACLLEVPTSGVGATSSGWAAPLGLALHSFSNTTSGARRPISVLMAAEAFLFLHPLALLISALWAYLRANEGGIRLRETDSADDASFSGLYRGNV